MKNYSNGEGQQNQKTTVNKIVSYVTTIDESQKRSSLLLGVVLVCMASITPSNRHPCVLPKVD